MLPLERGSVLTLLHVLPQEAAPASWGREKREAQRRLAREALAAAGRLRARKVRGVQIHISVVRGDPLSEIVDHAATADLVVLGRRGAGGFRAMLLGSIAERVVRQAQAPVLIVVANPSRPYRRPLIGVDLSETSRRALTIAARLAVEAPSLAILHVYEVPYKGMVSQVADRRARTKYARVWRDGARAALTRFVAALPPAPPDRALLLRHGDARAVILEAAHRLNADLIALGTHGRSGLPRALIGSIAESVIRHAACDVLIARPGQPARRAAPRAKRSRG
jgi:nucleotide-binding universal stress UspA family protein